MSTEIEKQTELAKLQLQKEKLKAQNKQAGREDFAQPDEFQRAKILTEMLPSRGGSSIGAEAVRIPMSRPAPIYSPNALRDPIVRQAAQPIEAPDTEHLTEMLGNVSRLRPDLTNKLTAIVNRMISGGKTAAGLGWDITNPDPTNPDQMAVHEQYYDDLNKAMILAQKLEMAGKVEGEIIDIAKTGNFSMADPNALFGEKPSLNNIIRGSAEETLSPVKTGLFDPVEDYVSRLGNVTTIEQKNELQEYKDRLLDHYKAQKDFIIQNAGGIENLTNHDVRKIKIIDENLLVLQDPNITNVQAEQLKLAKQKRLDELNKGGEDDQEDFSRVLTAISNMNEFVGGEIGEGEEIHFNLINGLELGDNSFVAGLTYTPDGKWFLKEGESVQVKTKNDDGTETIRTEYQVKSSREITSPDDVLELWKRNLTQKQQERLSIQMKNLGIPLKVRGLSDPLEVAKSKKQKEVWEQIAPKVTQAKEQAKISLKAKMEAMEHHMRTWKENDSLTWTNNKGEEYMVQRVWNLPRLSTEDLSETFWGYEGNMFKMYKIEDGKKTRLKFNINDTLHGEGETDKFYTDATIAKAMDLGFADKNATFEYDGSMYNVGDIDKVVKGTAKPIGTVKSTKDTETKQENLKQRFAPTPKPTNKTDNKVVEDKDDSKRWEQLVKEKKAEYKALEQTAGKSISMKQRIAIEKIHRGEGGRRSRKSIYEDIFKNKK
jgi:hypothetical protein